MEVRHLSQSRRVRISALILLLQSLNDTASLFRGEMAGDADSQDIHQSCFSVRHSTTKLGQLCDVVAEANKPHELRLIEGMLYLGG